MTEEGKDELEAIRAKKMAEFQRRYSTSKQDASRQPKKPEIDDETLVRSNLFERGDEVLNADLVQYPQATRQVISNIAGLFRSGKLKEPIPGEELLALFRDLGMRVHLETTISYLKDGKRITLSDKFKGKKPDD